MKTDLDLVQRLESALQAAGRRKRQEWLEGLRDRVEGRWHSCAALGRRHRLCHGVSGQGRSSDLMPSAGGLGMPRGLPVNDIMGSSASAQGTAPGLLPGDWISCGTRGGAEAQGGDSREFKAGWVPSAGNPGVT